MNRAGIIGLVLSNRGINADATETLVGGLLEAEDSINVIKFKGGSELNGKAN